MTELTIKQPSEKHDNPMTEKEIVPELSQIVGGEKSSQKTMVVPQGQKPGTGQFSTPTKPALDNTEILIKDKTYSYQLTENPRISDQAFHSYAGLYSESPGKEGNFQTERKLCDEEPRIFLKTTVSKGQILQFTIKRHVAKLGLSHPQYDLHLNGNPTIVCSAFKESMLSTNYSIFLYQNEQPQAPTNQVGQVISNFTGSQFMLYAGSRKNNKLEEEAIGQATDQRITGTVHYDQTFSISSKPRALDLYIPRPTESYTVNEQMQSIDLRQLYEGPNRVNYIKLVNRQPKWDEILKAYVLDFKGKASVKSPKNFILIDSELPEHQPDVMLLGKCADNEFNLDVSYPLNPLQAFEVAITAMAFKMGCQ